MDSTSYVVGEIWVPRFVNQDGVPGVALKQICRVDGSDEQRLVHKHLEKLDTRCNEVCLANG